jgi:hypothetical protein
MTTQLYKTNQTGFIKYSTALIILFLVMVLPSCKKSWLEEKQDKSLVVPTTIEDFQALLDNTTIFRYSPVILEVSADNFYLLPNTYQNVITLTDRNAYIWAQDIFAGAPSIDWNRQYQKVFYSNIVIEGTEQLIAYSNDANWKNLKGSALFHRAHAFYDLAQGWAKAYDASTATTDPGILIRLVSDVKVKAVRSTVKQTYDQIISDLLQSIPLLPVTPQYKTRPSKPAAFALLARTCLSMRDYDNVLKYADSALNYYSTLVDYNSLNPALTAPFAQFNAEVIFHQDAPAGTLSATNHIVDPNLYSLYTPTDDLRRGTATSALFFRTSGGFLRFKGHYTGTPTSLFGGIATDELYLMRAEAYARKDNAAAAMNDLNTLLGKRWKSTVFVPLPTTTAADALARILSERRRQLAFRIGIRWMDLRRLNKEGANITLTRTIGTETYTLSPNSNRYVLPIPDNEIQESGIEQNPR